MSEQKVVECVRKILVNEKGYPDPANSDIYDENNLIMYAQDDYKRNNVLFNNIGTGLLNHSSKCAEKNIQNKIWTDDVTEGKPEFIILNRKTNLAIVIECKKASKSNNHISPYLRDDGLLVGHGKIIGKYAVDGALHYAKFLSTKFDVLAIGISGIFNSSDLQITTYYWEKDKELFYTKKELKRQQTNPKTKVKETILEESNCCYGPFVNINLGNLQSYMFYQDFLNVDAKRIIKEFNEQKAIQSATELNIMLDGAGVNPTNRALLVSGLLLALKDRTFAKTYEDKDILSEDLQINLHTAIERIIDNEDISDDFKKKVLKDKFNDSFNQQDLIDNNAEKLRLVLEKLHKTVYPCMNGEFSVDVIGKFYHEFLSYAPNGQNNGIKLTPSQITDLFCELADLKVTDTVLDPCLGTGGFLISSMNKLFQLADNLDETDINDFFDKKLSTGDITQKQINRIKSVNKGLLGSEILTKNDVKHFIRKNQLVGCEADNIMYTLGCSNMILRGDGKSNILLGDCFKRKNEIMNFDASVGMINPPYSGSAYSVMDFLEFLCDCVRKEGKVVAIVPTSGAHSDDFLDIRNRLLQKNTLLGTMSMSLDLFKGIADTITCIMVFKAGIPHDFNKNVYFGNWKEDGYYWHSTRGMIPDNDKKKHAKTPEEFKTAWLKSFYNDDHTDDEYGCWKKLTLNKNGICEDEWLWEYFVETDYSTLTYADFEKVIKDYVLFNLKQLKLSDLDDTSDRCEGE